MSGNGGRSMIGYEQRPKNVNRSIRKGGQLLKFDSSSHGFSYLTVKADRIEVKFVDVLGYVMYQTNRRIDGSLQE